MSGFMDEPRVPISSVGEGYSGFGGKDLAAVGAAARGNRGINPLMD